MTAGLWVEAATAAAIAVPVWAAARRLETRAARRAARRGGRVSRGERAASTVSSRRAAVDVVYALACAHLGHTVPKPPTPRTTRPATQRARKGMLDSLIDGTVDGMVARAEHAVEQRAARNADVNRVVKVHGWQPDGTPARTTVTFPAGTDTAPGSKARTLWEAGWVERFGAGWVFRFDWPPNRTVVEMTSVRPRKPLPEHVDWIPLAESDRHTYTLGWTPLGWLRWNPLHHPHAKVAGKSRIGKSALLRVHALETLLADDWLYVIDPNGVDFAWCSIIDEDGAVTHVREGVQAVATSTAEAVNVLARVEAEIVSRRTAMRKAGVVKYADWVAACERDGTPRPPMVLVIVDEAAQVFVGRGQDDTEKTLREQASSKGQVVAAQGAKYGVFIEVATQYPYAHVMDGWRGNLDCSVAIGSMTAVESKLVLDTDSARFTQASKRDGVSPLPGRSVVRLGQEQQTQLAFLSAEVLERWAPPFVPVAADAPRPVRRPAAPSLVSVPDDPDMDELDPDVEVAEAVERGGDQPAAGIVRAW